ncbi:hypothetical protein IQ07DRAFT_273879 [Pyrenochaeta sp. DS3sAY3a]|nr:hypothetical protein IQ07DRAFT_273879 [Pyrenochaeta sp. DS3sAY3a]
MVYKFEQCQPDHKIPSDSDIDGPGVMAAFVITAWITIFTASFARLYSWQRVYKRFPSLVHLSIGANTLLGPLCDLQAITGAAILVAGFCQWNTITFYHRQIVVNYWWLISNSFWSSREAYMYDALDGLDSSWTKWRVYVRRLLITLNVALGIVYLSSSIQLENHYWDNSNPERCYTSVYNGNYEPFDWFWIVGLGFYELALLVSFVDTKARFATEYNRSLKNFVDVFHQSAIRRYGKIAALPPKSDYKILMLRLRHYLISAALWLLFIVFWVIRQLISVWTYGDGQTAIYLLFYFIFVGWNTYDILMLKIMNARLMEDRKAKMGFGQVLPLFLLLQIPLCVLDIWKDPKKRKERRFVPLDQWQHHFSA